MNKLNTQHSSTQESEQRPSANMQTVGTVLLSVTLGAIGQLTLKYAVNQMGKLELSISSLVSMATNPVLLIAMAIYAVSAVLWLLALMKAELSFAYPFLSLTYVAVLVGGAVLFHDQVTLLRVVGFVVIMSGLLVIALDERAKTQVKPVSMESEARIAQDDMLQPSTLEEPTP
jgi:multidrug transporter EmrE-like cation transporter